MYLKVSIYFNKINIKRNYSICCILYKSILLFSSYLLDKFIYSICFNINFDNYLCFIIKDINIVKYILIVV